MPPNLTSSFHSAEINGTWIECPNKILQERAKEAERGVLVLGALCGSVIRSMLLEAGQLSNSGFRLINGRGRGARRATGKGTVLRAAWGCSAKDFRQLELPRETRESTGRDGGDSTRFPTRYASAPLRFSACSQREGRALSHFHVRCWMFDVQPPSGFDCNTLHSSLFCAKPFSKNKKLRDCSTDEYYSWG